MNKAAFIDVDGTLTNEISSWEKAHHHFAKTRPEILGRMKYNTKQFFDGNIDYNTWAKLDVDLWKGCPYSDLKHALLPPSLLRDAKKGVQKLKDVGYKVYLVSGGIDILVKEVEVLVEAHGSISNGIGHTNGILDGSVSIQVGNSKVPPIHSLAKINALDIENSIAIGDNVNDLEMFKEVSYAMAINPKHSIVAKSANNSINTENFYDAVQLALKDINNLS